MTDIHSLQDTEAGLVILAITLEVSDIKQLSRLLDRISKQRGVMEIWRDTGQDHPVEIRQRGQRVTPQEREPRRRKGASPVTA